MRILTVILLLCFVLPTGLKLGLLVDYQARYDYYATVLCENKENQELECNGKCALMKDLKSVEQTNSEPEEPTSPNTCNTELYIENNLLEAVLVTQDENSKSPIHYTNLYSRECVEPIEHPPQLI